MTLQCSDRLTKIENNYASQVVNNLERVIDVHSQHCLCIVSIEIVDTLWRSSSLWNVKMQLMKSAITEMNYIICSSCRKANEEVHMSAVIVRF